ncbi:MAG: DUF4238 domain-containing protein [Thermoanaerobaculia bacterium]
MPPHYLPRMYLKRFLRDGRLVVYDRQLKCIRPDGLNSVATISDYYVTLDAAGNPDNSVEDKFLSDIESKATPALDLLARCARVTAEQHLAAAIFFATLCRRVPTFEQAYNHIADDFVKITMRRLAGTPELAANLLKRRHGTASITPEAMARFVARGDYTARPSATSRVFAMIEMARPLIAAFRDMDWWLLRSNSGTTFVTSDGPMGFLPLDGAPPTYGEETPRVLKFIALSTDVCLMFADKAADGPRVGVKVIDGESVAAINERLALAATRLIIGGDLAEVERVVAATNLVASDFVPCSRIVEWHDPGVQRSFSISHRVHHDTEYPLRLEWPWACGYCGTPSTALPVLASSTAPEDPNWLTEWLDTPCVGCRMTPRNTHTFLTATPVNMSPRDDW